MSSRVDESDLTISTTKELVTAHPEACAVVYQAVCAEAIRVVFALFTLSQSGVGELGNELRCCRTAMSERWRSPVEAVHHFAPQCHVRSSSLFQHTSSHDGTPARPQSQGSGEQLRVLSSSTEARGCITHASLYGLLTAAHLLRCSTWTAAFLVQGVWVEGHSALAQAPQLLAQARAAEELCTREPGWCATALVQFTEWLLFSLSPHFPSSLVSTLPSRALSVAEVEQTATDCRDVGLGSWPPVRSAADGALRDASMSAAHQRTVFVADPLPLYFPFLPNGKERSRAFASAPWHLSRVADALESGCAHRWLLNDLPRWCAQVALEEQSKRWHRTSLLRSSLERWRARRGLRVVAHLSHAAASAPVEDPHSPAMAADSFSPLPQTRTPLYAGVRKVVEGVLSSPSVPGDALETAPLSHTIATQTMAGTPRIDKVDSGGNGEPPAWSFREVLAADVSTIADDTAPPPSIPSQDTQRTSLPAAEVFAYTGRADAAASASNTRRLDSVLRGELTMQELPSRNTGVEEHTSSRNEECGQNQPARQRKTPPQQVRGGAEDALATSTPASTSSSKRGPSADASHFPAASNLTASSAPALSAREAKQEELARFMAQRRENTVLRQAFLHWRDRRLYESLAVRLMRIQRRESTRARCWAQWRRRRGAIVQRDKEMRDVARCDVYTEQKALQYFRALLQRWKTAALVRRFRISTAGHRVLRAWKCSTRFAQAQRAIQQQLIGARRVKWQAWTRWQERRQECVADRHRGLKHGAATLLLMRDACVRRQKSRVATSQCNIVVLKRALQRWALQCAIATRLRSFIESRQPRTTLVRQAWKTWRSRWLARQLQREQEHRLRAFRVARLAEVCFARWVQRWRRETHIRTCVARQQCRHVLRPLFLQWQQRMQVCFIVRQAQEELALKVSEQLCGRRILRTWRRRAAQHAAGRRGLLEALMDADADRLLRLNRLARTFYHWRAHGFVLRRYHLDRRRGLPVAAYGAAGMGSGRGHEAVFSIAGRTGVGHHSEADVDTEDCENFADPATTLPLPPPPSSAASPPVLPGRSRRGRLEYARRVPTRSAVSARSPKRLPACRSSATSVRQSTAAAAAARHEPTSTWRGSRDDEGRAAALSAPHGGPRVILCKQLAVPPRRRALALQRQLLATQLQQRPLFSRDACVRAASTGSRSTPPPRPVFSEPPYSTSAAPRRTTRPRTPPPSSTPGQHWHSNLSGSDAESPASRRSRTATPLFTARDAQCALRSPRSAALVESPHSSPPQLRQSHSGAHVRGYDDCATLGSSSASSTPAHRLLGQMERLLRRIRNLEAGYPAQATAAV
ncbi:conserved hypothetical protein [Leishmania major strain Friedlin]|uniref:Sfi1 spindle body domain-containing protein n=1 Tax=Leishmania major TaxID=5664 RepID=Q4Q368_LEIMA|nr:conserved hypothetical protein [Leishmania major strain Friedlin]CAG9581990.1 hypothetical_protein_-_conserved [Leishmania major strain Friedlin]CAJ07844.1 conserved hypothetical protein [Leishmania major strain Friedlin]|eukprot:XP_001686230.1 conserved hypothetical protein [Leishmania major strain Friedlin]